MRPVRSIAAHVAAGILLVWLLASCGASQRQQTIAATLSATDSASKSFVAWDDRHQHTLLDASPDKATYAASITPYRAEQLKVAQIFAGVYRAIAVALTLNDDPSLNGAVQAALILGQELHALGVLP